MPKQYSHRRFLRQVPDHLSWANLEIKERQSQRRC